MKWVKWQRGDPPEAKRKVWTAHQRTDLDTTLLALIEAFGPPDSVAIRETDK